MRIDGGISDPSVPEAATTPVASDGWYFAFNISGTAIFDIAAVVAMEEPEAAANKPQAPTLAEANPPGTRANNTRSKSNAPAVSPVFAAINPIKRNMGIAVSDQSPIKLNGMALTMPSAACRLNMMVMPTNDTAINAVPMDMRKASRPNNVPTPIQPITRLLMTCPHRVRTG
ncbi:hypothetical protein NBRC116599_33530 [Aquicoccus sp. SU-CL01552]